jgi:hypothetical protein
VALPRLVEIGGSHAQRDLFPQSLRLKRQLRPVYAALGLPEVSL